MKTFAHAGRWFRLLHGALVAGLVLALTGAAETQTRPAASPVSTFTPERIEDIRQLLVDFVEGQRKSVGIVIGIVTPTHRQVMSVGHAGDNAATPLNGESVFRIASVTKVFTALLLAEMVQRRELALTDPVGTHLPIAVRIPERNGRSITLLDLVTHTSGLPPAPKDFPSLTDPSAARYSVDQLYQFLSTYELAREPGSQWQYGNLDMALLGHAMAYRAGTDYESLLRERILIPLGLADTAVTPSPGMRSRQAIGHDTQLQPITRAETPAMAAAGSMWSSTNDLMRFLAAVIGHDDSPLAPAMRAMVDVRRPMPWLGSREITVTAAQALGWFVFERGGDVIIEHDGGTPGYAAAIAYDPRSRAGVVVLSNASPLVGDLARHLLRPDLFPLSRHEPALARTAVPVDIARLDEYVGRYQLIAVGPRAASDTDATIDISRDGDELLFHQLDGPRTPLRPASDREFFASDVDLRVTFLVDGQGRVTGLALHRFGRDVSARRVDTGLRER